MKAFDILKKLKGLNEPAKVVAVEELPALLCQEGTDCDCKGCDKD